MISSLLSGNIEGFIISLLLSLPIVFLSLSIHEVSHGYIACKLGDPTANSLGRLSLNPLKHIDPLGFICMLLCGFGWAKPVPINSRYFKKPKRDMALTAAAGPISNLLLAVAFALLLKLSVVGLNLLIPRMTNILLAENIYMWTVTFFTLAIRINVVFAVFNLIPVPPFDGSRILLAFLPSRLYFKIMKYEQIIYVVLMVALIMGLLDTPIELVSNFFINIIFKLI